MKQPAYAKALLAERRAGRHPLSINLVFGDKWSAVDAPKICIKPADYARGVYDFTVVAGVAVKVFDQQFLINDFDLERQRFGPIYYLFAELSALAAYVEVDSSKWELCDMGALAWAQRTFDSVQNRFVWPRWWSDDLERRQRLGVESFLKDSYALAVRKPIERVHTR